MTASSSRAGVRFRAQGRGAADRARPDAAQGIARARGGARARPRAAAARDSSILIVEDNEDNLFTLRQILGDLLVELVTAASGREAIEYCRRRLPDVIIMDMQMPGMSGLQATGAIRALPGGPTIPIVALTAQAMKGDRERILAAGCDEYLAKPIQPKVLLAVVKRLLAAARPRRSEGAVATAAPTREEEESMARILLVDDNQDSRFAVVETLRKLTEHVVDEARTGPPPWSACAASDYDLVLLDVQMPGMDGFEVCRRLRADERTRRVPVLFLTATHYQVESRLEGLEVGADDFIVQPISNQELVARIKSVLRVKALADEIRQHNTELESKVRQRTVDVEKLADELRAERDILRETFDVFDEGLSLVGPSGALEVVNATGRAPLRHAGCAASWRRWRARRSTADAPRERDLAHAGAPTSRAPTRCRAGVPCCTCATSPTSASVEVRRLQAEKLASIGMLAAGVAHEINNPAAFVLANIEALLGPAAGLIEEKSASCPSGRRGAAGALATCCSRPRRSCRSRRRGWPASTASCATWDRSRTPTTTPTAPMQREHGRRVGADHAAQRAQVPRARRARPARDAGGARQLGAPRAGVPEPDHERRPGAGRGGRQAQRGHGQQLRRRRQVVVEVAGQRPGHPARGLAAHLRFVLHHQAARRGYRPGAADLAGHRALAGRRDHRREPARRGLDLPRPPAGGGRRRSVRRRRRVDAHPSASTRAGASWPSTTRRCCSRPTAAC